MKKINRLIREKKQENLIIADPLNKYYLLFNRESEREIDLKKSKGELRELLNEKFTKIETLEIKLRIAKMKISTKLQKL